MIIHWDDCPAKIPTAPVIAHPTRETVQLILGAFRSHAPITLLHPKVLKPTAPDQLLRALEASLKKAA